MANDYVVYLIQNENRTYVGMSNDPMRRLRQHNQEIKGGARYTRAAGPGWHHVLFVEGFDDKISASQFEWAVKHEAPRNAHGVSNRIRKFVKVLNKPRWTLNAKPSDEYDLTVVWFGCGEGDSLFRELNVRVAFRDEKKENVI